MWQAQKKVFRDQSLNQMR